jgi:hypothetical protein
LLVRYFVSRWEEPAADERLIALLRRFEPLASLPADDLVAAVGPSVHDYLTRRAIGRATPGRDD